MAAPIPVSFVAINQPPDVPRNVQELMNLLADSLGARFDPGDYIIGQFGGILPKKDVGPWASNGTWWFYSSSQGAYVRASDGVPVGTIMIWGGQGAPPNWLICDGSQVAVSDYPLLFQAIHTDWGGTANADGTTNTFNLPPPACFYLGDGSFTPDPLVPLNPISVSVRGWGLQGGAQIAPLLTVKNLPQLQVQVKTTLINKNNTAPAGYGLSVLQPASDTGADAPNYQVLTPVGVPLNVPGQTQFSTMPPFAAANFVIKYQ